MPDIEVQQDEIEQKKEEISEKTYTQKEIDAIAGKTRNEGKAQILKKLGVEKEEDLENFINNLKSKEGYVPKSELDKYADYDNLKVENLCYKIGVKNENINDVLTFLKGSGKEVNEENINEVLNRFPSFKNEPLIKSIGSEKGTSDKQFKQVRKTF